ncbi:MAG: hypothetical protein ACK5N9_02125, partial [Pirellula sp.]
ECLASVAFDLGQGFAPRIGSLRPGNENPKAYRPAIMKLPMVTIGAHRYSQNSPEAEGFIILLILAFAIGTFNTMYCFFDSKSRQHAFWNATTDRDYLDIILMRHHIDLSSWKYAAPMAA